MSGRPRGLAALLLRACLRSWPAAARARDGEPMISAALEDMAGRVGARRALWLLGECLSVARSGLALRWRAWRSRHGPGRRGAALPDHRVRGAPRARPDWLADVRFAMRALVRSPGFTAVATLTLALGIGATASVSGLVERLILEPPPFEDPGRLVLVWSTIGDAPARYRVTAPDAAAIAERVPAFASAAFTNRITDAALQIGADPSARHVRVGLVTADLFAVLGVEPALGRTWTSDEATIAAGEDLAPRAVLLSDATWRGLFGGDVAALGRDIRLDGGPATVIGVMPPGFRIPMPPDVGIAADADVWVPLRIPLDAFARSDGRLVDEDSDNSGAVVARLREDASLTSARAQLARLAEQMRNQIPTFGSREGGFTAASLHEDATRHLRPLAAALVSGVVGLLVLMCLNVSTLLLARGTGRDREVSVRIALGAGRGRVAHQLLLEGALLVVAGTAAGAVIAVAISGAMTAIMPFEALSGRAVSPSVPMLLVASTLALVTILGASLGPLIRSVVADRGLSAMGVRGVARSSRLREVLVVGQVASSVVLLMGSGLLVRSAQALGQIDPGFAPSGALAFALSLRTPERYPGPADRARLVRAIEEELRTIPGVRSAGTTTHLPLSGRLWVQPYALPAASEEDWRTSRADFRAATSGYFEAIGTRLLEGRTFTPFEDLNEERRVVVVDVKLAARLATDGTAVGRSIRIPLDGREVLAEIVGVVEHVRHERLDQDGREAVYVPYRQEASREVSFVVRSDAGAGVDPGATAEAIRGVLERLDPGLAPYGLESLERRVDEAIAPTRLGVVVLSAFALLATLAVSIGLYGVVSVDAARRRRDYGLRIAVGARRLHVMRQASSVGVRTAVVGCGVGVAAGAVTVRTFRSAIGSVSVTDPATWLFVLGVVTVVTVVACLGPAVRASRVDPTTALRAE